MEPFGCLFIDINKFSSYKTIYNRKSLSRLNSHVPRIRLRRTADVVVLPGVLGTRALRRTVKVGLGFDFLRLRGCTPIFTVS
jgi:hypothetical protein